MDRNAILNAMEKKAKEVFESSEEYIAAGKRGMLIVDIRDEKNKDQWDSTCRPFGVVYRDYQYEGELVISNGTNFDALAHGKIAFSRRTAKDSGTNYYQVLGYESFWHGAVMSDDQVCICAFAGFMGLDDREIANAGIACYESLKRAEERKAAKKRAEENQDEEEKLTSTSKSSNNVVSPTTLDP